jgi:hypothetical protein
MGWFCGGFNGANAAKIGWGRILFPWNRQELVMGEIPVLNRSCHSAHSRFLWKANPSWAEPRGLQMWLTDQSAPDYIVMGAWTAIVLWSTIPKEYSAIWMSCVIDGIPLKSILCAIELVQARNDSVGGRWHQLSTLKFETVIPRIRVFYEKQIYHERNPVDCKCDSKLKVLLTAL